MEKLTVLSVFNGTQCENPVLWRYKIVDYLDHAGYAEDEDKLRVIHMYLGGGISIWWKNLEGNQKINMQHFFGCI